VAKDDRERIARLKAQQAALGGTLRTLGQAPYDLDAILDAILHYATALGHAERGFVYLRGDDGLYRHAAAIGATDEIVALNLSNPLAPERGTLVGRTALTRQVVHVPDVDGQILLSPRARARGERRATVHDAGEMTIKGFSQPIRVSELISLHIG
jgi:class 3 adenylate cyclase